MPEDLIVAVEIVRELNFWIYEKIGDTTEHVANLCWWEDGLTIAIGDVSVYHSEVHQVLTIEGCKEAWLGYCEDIGVFAL
jgi:hypothetical protein